MMIKSSPQQIQQLIEENNTFIVNIVASWCPDCTKQANNLDKFVDSFSDIDVYQVNVQDQRNDYLSIEHQVLTEQFGGHGYPRTVLIKDGKVIDADNVEVISKPQLSQLAVKFQQQI